MLAGNRYRKPAHRTGPGMIMASILGLFPAAMASAQTPDTSDWKCEYCPWMTGWEGSITAGAGQVSDDSFKFGDYTGLEQAGGFAILEGALSYRDGSGYYTSLYLEDAGLESRSLGLEGGRQGTYNYRFSYDNLPHFIAGTTRTPFSGENTLSLPGDWIHAGNTSGMSALPAALHDAELLRERETLAIGFDFMPGGWEYTADFRRQIRSGVDAIGGSFLNSGALLPMTIDYVTDQADLGVAFDAGTLQLGAAYYGSYFRNEDKALTWENPFSPIAAGADTGQLALAPDNDFHQLSVSAAWQPGPRTRLNAGVATGEMRQDETFVAATVNADLGEVALPRSSLNGEVDTLNYHLRLTSNPLRRLDLRFEHRYSERDNRSPREVYRQVDADIFLSGLKANIPYSFERGTTEASASYRLPGNIKLTAGAERDVHERSFQDVAETEQDSQWGEISAYFGMLDLRLKLARESRDASAHDPFEDVATQENPALRKFNLADRERELGSAYIAIAPLAWLSIGFTFDATEDDYSDSRIGLTAAEQHSRAVDVSITPVPDITVYFFSGLDEIDSDMAGSSNFAAPNWFAAQRDTVRTDSVGTEFGGLFEKLDLGVDYTRARSRGEISLLPQPEVPFPDLKTRLHSARLYARYALEKHLLLRFDYYKERYSAQDWALDGVAPDTIPTLLTLGQDSPSYNVTVLGAAAEYRF